MGGANTTQPKPSQELKDAIISNNMESFDRLLQEHPNIVSEFVLFSLWFL